MMSGEVRLDIDGAVILVKGAGGERIYLGKVKTFPECLKLVRSAGLTPAGKVGSTGGKRWFLVHMADDWTPPDRSAAHA
ncbi:MAG: hypothetical protein E6R04_06905 [Spirochaetes bacterium]|nr:MAG: hypothetical protein E6R04_06905 [Spirochaetota bacterium]